MAHDMVVNQQWSLTAAESYLSTHCINAALTKEILDHADNCLQFNIAMSDGVDEEIRAQFVKEKRQ